MTYADAAVALFTLFNALRVLAYVPQIIKIWQDANGARAISYTTWSLFGASHFSTVAYALLEMGDGKMAAVFAANGISCTAILVLTAYKRWQVPLVSLFNAFGETVRNTSAIQGNAAS